VISKIDFSEKNLTSNLGTLMLNSYTNAQGISRRIDEKTKFNNPSIKKIKIHHIKFLFMVSYLTLIYLENTSTT